MLCVLLYFIGIFLTSVVIWILFGFAYFCISIGVGIILSSIFYPYDDDLEDLTCTFNINIMTKLKKTIDELNKDTRS